MPRVRIHLGEGQQGIDLELESSDETIDELIVKTIKLVSGLGDWLDQHEKKPAPKDKAWLRV
jgi:hypothetical protein